MTESFEVLLILAAVGLAVLGLNFWAWTRLWSMRSKGLAERDRQLQLQEKSQQRQRESFAKKEALLEAEQANLAEKGRQVEERESSVNALIKKWQSQLASVAALTAEEARKEFMKFVERESQTDARVLAQKIVEKARQEGEGEARRIISTAIQRYAAHCASETTTASVVLKEGDDIKGRIIGRDGRNIRAFENAAGVTVLVEDTPNTVVLSGFDPVRREIARESMARLVADGRIHPARIEEVVEKVSSEMAARILKIGNEAVCNLRLAPVHTEISKRLGRLYFRRSHSQNVLDHSVEVARLTMLIAVELGVDAAEAARSGLLHDVGKALGDEVNGSHAVAGAEFIRRHGENETIVNAVASHHNDVEPTVLGMLVGAADAISASRPGARSESTVAYVNRIKVLETVALSFAGVERCFAMQAGREVRVFVQPEKVTDEAAYALARDICREIEEQAQYPGQIKVTVIREVRCIHYAK